METGQTIKVGILSYCTTAENIPDIKRNKLLWLIVIIIIPELLKADAKKGAGKGSIFYLNISLC